jgi:hypothetical protein
MYCYEVGTEFAELQNLEAFPSTRTLSRSQHNVAECPKRFHCLCVSVILSSRVNSCDTTLCLSVPTENTDLLLQESTTVSFVHCYYIAGTVYNVPALIALSELCEDSRSGLIRGI